MPEDIRLGWKKDKRDERDYLHPTLKAVRLPVSIDLSNFLPSVRNQGSVGSCTGFGLGANVTATHKQQSADPEWETPTWIYNLGRKKEGTLAIDNGAYPRDCLEGLVESGMLKEHFWPYDAGKLDPSDPDTHKANARKYADFTYYRCVDGIDGILSALAAGHMVSIGSPWFDKWMTDPGTVALPEVTAADRAGGGHETCLYGYDQNRRLIFGQNSWGEGWGNKGRYLMPFSAIEVFKQPPLWGYDAHYMTFTAQPVPEPPEPPGPPGPTPSPCKWGNGVATVLNTIFMQKARGRKGRFAYMDFPDK